MKKLSIKSGQKYYSLTVIKEIERVRDLYRRFLWKCDCGKEVEADLSPVKVGNTKTCGCALKKHVKNQKRMEESCSWKGGRRTESGYVLIYRPHHHNAKSNGYIREHQLVMSDFLGRNLIKGENVHHLNGQKDDNRIENLELWSTSQPCGQRVEDKLKWANEIIQIYGKINFDARAPGLRQDNKS